MNFIKEIIGVSVIESLEIQSNNEYLLARKPFFDSEFECWLERFGFEQDTSKSFFRDDFYTHFIGGNLDESFYSVMFNQTLDWYRAGLSQNRVMLILSHCRQIFILIAEKKDNSLLAKGLCHIVDLVQSIVNSVFQLRDAFSNMKKRSRLEEERMRRSFQLISAEEPKELIQAFIDHQNWKIRAYSVALGNIPEGDFPFSTSECNLGKWLNSGGMDKIPEEQREPFTRAHETIHSLGFITLKEAKLHHPEKIVNFLSEMENASDIVCDVLLECIDQAFLQAATKDALTGLANRGAFDVELKQKIAFSKRYKFWLGFIMIDIDFFKSFNDNFGHDYGDQVLIEVAQVLNQSIRAEDNVYRWGGEEFAVLTIDKESAGITVLAERIRAAVAKYLFCATTENPVNITISLGSVAFDHKLDKTLNEMFVLVDEQLYLAKQNGRNRVNARTLEAD